LNLAAHGGRIYRVGGMQPRNAAGAAQDIWSVADAARFDPATKRWEPLPPLPSPRSSHDVVVVGHTLVVLSIDDGRLFQLGATNAWQPIGTATPRIVHRLVPSGRGVLVAGGGRDGQNSDLVEALQLGQ
jgi:hypothetical protein